MRALAQFLGRRVDNNRYQSSGLLRPLLPTKCVPRKKGVVDNAPAPWGDKKPLVAGRSPTTGVHVWPTTVNLLFFKGGNLLRPLLKAAILYTPRGRFRNTQRGNSYLPEFFGFF